jgi:hypothetical protein
MGSRNDKRGGGVGKNVIFSLAIALSSLITTSQVNADPLPWQNKTLKIVVTERQLVDVLREVFMDHQIDAVIDPSIDTVIKNTRYQLRPQEFVDLLNTRYKIAIRFDGRVAHVTPVRD